jgi:hypothetical protein
MSYYERHLPHWHPEHAAIFVTWRLHGSLPSSTWVDRPDMPAGKAFVSVDRELAKAATGPTWLKDERVAQCVVDTLRFGEESLRLYRLEAWVLMSNHVHILIEPNAEVAQITGRIKSFSAKQGNEILGRTGERFWQDESYDRWVRTSSSIPSRPDWYSGLKTGLGPALMLVQNNRRRQARRPAPPGARRRNAR